MINYFPRFAFYFNMRPCGKGFKTFKWLDENLDFERYSMTFMGNIPDDITFRNIQHQPPVTSEKLAPVLKQHDVYLAASYLEPCSNALVEALASGGACQPLPRALQPDDCLLIVCQCSRTHSLHPPPWPYNRLVFRYT